MEVRSTTIAGVNLTPGEDFVGLSEGFYTSLDGTRWLEFGITLKDSGIKKLAQVMWEKWGAAVSFEYRTYLSEVSGNLEAVPVSSSSRTVHFKSADFQVRFFSQTS